MTWDVQLDSVQWFWIWQSTVSLNVYSLNLDLHGEVDSV